MNILLVFYVINDIIKSKDKRAVLMHGGMEILWKILI